MNDSQAGRAGKAGTVSARITPIGGLKRELQAAGIPVRLPC